MNQPNLSKFSVSLPLIALSGLFLGSGCAAITPTYETVEGHKIYDIQTHVTSVFTGQLASKLKEVIQKNAGDMQFNNSIPPANLPEKPGRYTLIDPLKNSPGLLALTGGKISMQIPSCEGAVIEAISHRPFSGSENTTFIVCLFPYQRGYQMDVYYKFSKASGGLSTQALGNALAQSLIGDSRQFIPDTISALENAVKAAGFQFVLIDSYPN